MVIKICKRLRTLRIGQNARLEVVHGQAGATEEMRWHHGEEVILESVEDFWKPLQPQNDSAEQIESGEYVG